MKNKETQSSQSISSLYNQANAFIKDKNLEEADQMQEKLFNIGTNNHSLEAFAYAKLIQGVLKITRRSFDEGFICFHEALKIAEKLEDKKLVQLIHTDLGKWYCEFNELDTAIQLLQKVLDNDPDNTQALNIIAISFARKQEYKKAIKYFIRKYDMSKQQNDDQNRSVAASNIALCYIPLEAYGEALDLLLEAFEIESKYHNKTRLANITNSIAIVHTKQANYTEALDYALKANKIAEEIEDFDEIERSLNSLYTIYRNTNEHEKAYQSIDRKQEIQTIRNNAILSNRIKDLENLINYERNSYLQKEQELQKNNESFRLKYEHFQSAYKELLNTEDVGVFSEKIKNIIEIAYFFHKDRNISVLIEGETGTGKEIIARVVHFGKDDEVRPFISINCSAISPSLFESELFGYEDGAFTGARAGGMIGKFELAQGGTLFLDEIGEMPIELQSKLLRVIQEKEYYKVGGQKPIKLDVRIVCATNRDLKVEMENKRFRPDLFYRLSTGRIFIPPLRERREEIAPLAQMFMIKFSDEKKKKFQFIDNEAMKLLEEYHWYGNIRELQNTIERIIILYDDRFIRKEHLNFINSNHSEILLEDTSTIVIDLKEEGLDFRELQKHIMKQVLKRFNGNKTQAAKYLGIARKTLYENDI